MPLRKKTYKKKPYRKTYKKYKKRKGNYTNVQTLMVRTPGAIVPDKLMCKLMYTDTATNILGSSTSNSYGWVGYRINDLYDPNPLILSGRVPGFVELQTLYRKYRVVASSIKIVGSNMMDIPCNILIWPSVADQTSLVGSNNYLQEMISNPFVKYKSISAKGGQDKFYLKNYISVKKLIGDASLANEDIYTGGLTTDEPLTTFWNVASYSLNGSNYASPWIPFECRITFYCQFFSRQTLAQ